jgi:hypothetical protein
MSADGLERHPSLDDRFDPAVRIDYEAAWPALAEAELHRIEETLGGVAVRLEHVGSTAVPGLAAKPILDLLPPSLRSSLGSFTCTSARPAASTSSPPRRPGLPACPRRGGGTLRGAETPGGGTPSPGPARLHRGQERLRRCARSARGHVGSRARLSRRGCPIRLRALRTSRRRGIGGPAGERSS